MAATRNKEPLTSPPTLSDMMRYIAKLGGHLGRKKDLNPSVKAIWVGICKLHNYADAWDLFGPGAKTKNEIYLSKKLMRKTIGAKAQRHFSNNKSNIFAFIEPS